MGGLDALVFTAGVGENNDVLREKICEGLDWMGIKIDHEKDKGKRTECEVSAAEFPREDFRNPHQRGAGYRARYSGARNPRQVIFNVKFRLLRA